MPERRFLGMRAWAQERFGKSPDAITLTDIERILPRRDDLQEPPFEDRLGGRVRYRLRPWPSDDEAADLRRRAQHFVDESPAD
jgi:hypothetical protein